MNAPFKLIGGKGNRGLNKWVLSHFPKDYQLYIEPFCGSAALFYNKEKSPQSILNDINPDFVEAHLYIKHLSPTQLNRLERTKHDEATFKNALERLENPKCKDRGYYTLIRQRMSRSGLGRTYSASKRQRGGQDEGQNAWDNFVKNVPLYKEKLDKTSLCNYDFSKVFDDYGVCSEDAQNYFLYVDCPYLEETRTKNLYEFEFTKQDHIILAAYLLTTPAKVLLSGYDSELYRQIYEHWNFATLEVANHSGQNSKKERRREFLWKNY